MNVVADEFEVEGGSAEVATEQFLWNNLTNDAVCEELAAFYRDKIRNERASAASQ